MTKTLALLGGSPVRTKPFPADRLIGEAEITAVREVMETNILSKFLGSWHPDFFGGPQVQAFEQEWAKSFDVAHAISVNSCTSGLYAAVGAAGVGPGDEVIVSPYTMAASATAPLIFNAVPVFADIDPRTYNISAETIRPRLTARTKAIIVVHIFGLTADMDPIMDLAREHGLVVIEDCAQAPFATYKGRPAGKLGHMGVFSLNYHKHIHTGEGGVVTTDDDGFAERVQLIRNHAEAVVGAKGVANLVNMIGFNFRLGEIEAAIGRQQLLKGPSLIERRIANIRHLEQGLAGLPGLTMPHVPEAHRHVYCAHAMTYDATVTGIRRELVVRALRAELAPTELREGDGPLLGQGYVRPLYLLPIFQEMVGYGDKQCPFRCPHYDGTPNYGAGLCPNAEDAHFRTLLSHDLARPSMATADLDAVIGAFHKVWQGFGSLRDAFPDEA